MEIYIRFKRKNGDIDYYCLNFPIENESIQTLYMYVNKIFKENAFRLYNEKEFIIPDKYTQLKDILKDGIVLDYVLI